MTKLSDKKVLVIDTSAQYTSVAQRLAKDFDTVYYCVNWQHSFPKYNLYCAGMNVPEITRVDSPFEVLDIVDMIVFPDLFFGQFQDWLRGKDYVVFGSGSLEKIETNRDEFFELQEQLGLPVSGYEVVKGMTKLRKHLKGQENKWIKSNIVRGNGETFHYKDERLSESRLNEMQHTLGAYSEEAVFCVCDPVDGCVEIGHDTYLIDGKQPNKVMVGVEIKDKSYVTKVVSYDTIPKVLQTLDSKFEDTYKQGGYRGNLSTEVRWDGKKGYCGDLTCFSDDTEVLTDNGWKYFYELEVSDKVCTLNPSNRNIEFHKPYDYISQYFKGNLIHFSNSVKSIDSLVTPNHSVWRTDRNKKGLFEQRADSVTDKGYIPRVGNWAGVEVDFFELKEYHHEWDWVNQFNVVTCTKVKHEPAKKIKADDWFAFLGWYLSEGSCGGAKNSKKIKCHASISQTKYVKEVDDVLSRMGLKYKRYEKNKTFQISSVQLCQELQKFGRKEFRYIPEYLKKASQRQIRIFLDNFQLADGSPDGMMFTISKRMADDLQELCLKCGTVANISLNKTAGTTTIINGKEHVRTFDIYHVQEYQKRTDYWFETQARKDRYIKEVPYDGLVFDVTVKNHIIYVRRNGKPYFSGNCRMPQPPSDLQQLIFDNYSEIIWKVAHGEIPEIKATKKYGCQIIMKCSLGEPVAIYFPAKYKDHVKIKNLMYKGDIPYHVPFSDIEMEEIGSVVATGSTLQEAIELAKKIASEVQGDCVRIDSDSLDEALGELKKLEKFGIKLF